MGVDATLFVLADYSGDGRAFVKHVFSLNRDRDLWGPLGNCQDEHKHHKWPQVQLPHGSHSNFGVDEIPEGHEDCEWGWLQQDSYGTELWAFKGKHLANVKRENDGTFPDEDWEGTFNQSVFAFVATHFPEHDVVVFWH